jgi:hypothetical protein
MKLSPFCLTLLNLSIGYLSAKQASAGRKGRVCEEQKVETFDTEQFCLQTEKTAELRRWK